MAISKPDFSRVWGSAANPIDIADPGGKYSTGWLAELPPHETENFVQKFQDIKSAYLNQEGIPPWDADTIYSTNAYTKAADGLLYVSQREQSGHDPISDNGSNWRPYEVSDYYEDFGGANSYRLYDVSDTPATKTYYDGMRVRFIPANDSTGSSTINVRDIGVRSLRTVGGNTISRRAIKAGVPVTAFYNAALDRFIATELYLPHVKVAGIIATRSIPDDTPTTLVYDDVLQYDADVLYNSVTGVVTIPGPCVFTATVVNVLNSGGTSGQVRNLGLLASGSGSLPRSISQIPSIAGQFTRQAVTTTGIIPINGELKAEVRQQSGGTINVTGGSTECAMHFQILKWL